MTNQTISHSQVKEICDDVSYLQDEAEALKYLIDRVPYEEQPPEGYSIINTLRLIDYAQQYYYRPAIENTLSDNRAVKLNEYEDPETGFETMLKNADSESADIQKVLNKIIKHRAAILNIIDKISLFEWEKNLVAKNKREITLFDFVNEMIRKERGYLKKVADLILLYQNEKEHQREVQKRSSNKNFNHS